MPGPCVSRQGLPMPTSASEARKIGQIRQFWPVFATLFLDSGPPAAITPASGAGFLAPLVFVRNPQNPRVDLPKDLASQDAPITTDQKAGPDLSEAGIEHEGIKRCSQSSKPAAGSSASLQMICLRLARSPAMSVRSCN